MKKFIQYCLLFILPLIAGWLILFNLPYDKYFAYHYIADNCYDRGGSIYNRVFEQQTSVDIAFIGTSHTMNSVKDSMLDKLLELKTGKQLHVANLGFCWQGYNAEYVILKDLFARKNPQVIVLEVREWTENDNHIIFPYIADVEDIFSQPYLNKLSCIPNLYHATLSRWDYFRFGLTKLQAGQDEKFYGYEYRNENLNTGDAEYQYQFQNKRFGPSGTHINNYVRSFDKYYLTRINELCQMNNADLYFIYIPSFGDIIGKPIDDEFFPASRLLIPDRKILTDQSNWGNKSHLNDKGANELTNWLANSNLFSKFESETLSAK